MVQPFVAKLPKASMGEDVWLIESREDWHRYCERTDVLYAQEYLPLDRDARVVIVGDKVVAAYWRTQAEQGFYNNLAQGGGFDIALVEGYPYVLEFNRLFGNKGLGQGSDLKNAILEYLQQQSEPRDPSGPTGPEPVWLVAV